MGRGRKRYRSDRLVEDAAAGESRSSCSGGRGVVILVLRKKRKSPLLSERASLYPEPCAAARDGGR